MSNDKVSEQDFTDGLIEQLRPFLAPPLQISTKMNLLHSLTIDEHGNVNRSFDETGHAIRGGGTGFEQDILVFERAEPTSFTTVIPRLVAEVKFKGITTHDVMTYAEKAKRIRTVYPYARYGFIIGAVPHIPARAIRLGEAFDFIVAVSYPTPPAEIESLAALFQQEVASSKQLASILPGWTKLKRLHRPLVFSEIGK